MNDEPQIPSFPNPLRRERLLNLAELRRARQDTASPIAHEAPESNIGERIPADA
jgi:hypothetical protein